MTLGIALDVAIGLAMMYLLLSLMVTAVNELLAQFGGIRAKHLHSALRTMLNLSVSKNDKENLKLFDAIYASPTFQIAGGISRTYGAIAFARPSYVKRDTFIAALREAIVALENPKGNPVATDIGTLIGTLPDGSAVKRSLMAAIGDARATVEETEKRIGDWFDGMMERASGSYKRWMSTFSLLIGLVLAVALNCDTLLVAERLAKSPEMRAKVTAAAEIVVKNCTGANGKPALDESKCKGDIQKNMDALQALPIGWDASNKPPSDFLEAIVWFFSKLCANPFGFIATALAVSLGAPFWFDLLSKFMNVRSGFKGDASASAAK